jgi:ABC-type transport system substrate-binding protein
MWLSTPMTSLDPAASSTNPIGQLRILTSGQLYRLDKDGKPQAELVDSSTTSTDGLTVTMKLKSGLKYSDGSAVTAQDVVASYQHDIVAKPGGDALFTPFVKSIEASDATTVVWHLITPYAGLAAATGQSGMLIHPAAKIEDKTYWDNPVSAGPYMLQNWHAGDPIMHLVENPNYVGGELMVKAIDSSYIADATQAVLQLQNGDLDFAWALPYTFVAQAKGKTDIAVVKHPTGGVFQLGINTTKSGPLGDAKVRQAISLAINRQQIDDTAFLGITTVNPAWVPSSAAGYQPVLPGNGAQDVAGAKALLAQTQWPNGFAMSIDTFAEREAHPETVLLLQQQLAAIGIKVTANPVPSATSLARLNANNFDAFFQGSVAPTGPSVLVVDFCPSGVWGRWMPSGNPKICALATQAMTEADPTQTMVEAQQMALNSMPIVPILTRRDVVGSRIGFDVVQPVNNTPWVYVETVAQAGN